MADEPVSTSDQVRTAVAALIGTAPHDIPGDANLVFLGLGSLDVMRLSSRWRREGLPVEFEVLTADPTIDSWARHLDSLRPRSN
ncbi:phosphopantetheine-binding protein [Streptomyces sp. MMBL 11-3]|uniref:EsmD3 n=1 Tax=Streptomyces antibioticus TaxID=1890 RepID=H6ACY6_STRAT|nr:EsmD3 [Streptomyces antibioticus]